MNQQKTFDCVQMKTEIQDRLLREVVEFGEEEATRLRHERLRADPILGGFLVPKRASQRPDSEHTPAA